MDGFIGEIRVFPWTFTPEGWLRCDGSRLLISQFTVLYSVIGVYFGGDAQSYFLLPNFAGMAPMGAGQGAGLTYRTFGQPYGAETVALTSTSFLPSHTHALNAQFVSTLTNVTAVADSNGDSMITGLHTGNGTKLAKSYLQGPQTTPNTTLHRNTIDTVGGVQGVAAAHINQQPYLAMNYCICTDGLYPMRP